jgi:hypothetical protein
MGITILGKEILSWAINNQEITNRPRKARSLLKTRIVEYAHEVTKEILLRKCLPVGLF